MAVDSNIYWNWFNAMPKQASPKPVNSLLTLANSYMQGQQEAQHQSLAQLDRQKKEEERQLRIRQLQQQMAIQKAQEERAAQRQQQELKARDNAGYLMANANGDQDMIQRAASYDPAYVSSLLDIQKKIQPEVQKPNLKYDNGQIINLDEGTASQVSGYKPKETKPLVDMSGANIGSQGQSEYGNVEPGFRRVFYPDGSAEDIPITGSKVWQERQDEQAKANKASQVTMTAAQTVFEDSKRALNLIEKFGSYSTGETALVSDWLPTAPAGQLKKHIDSIKGNIGVDQLLKIKQSGAGLGQIPQTQLEMLASMLGTLDPRMEKTQLIENITRINEIYADIVRAEGGDPIAVYNKRFGEQQNNTIKTAEDFFKVKGIK